jgi:hypothetical protein
VVCGIKIRAEQQAAARRGAGAFTATCNIGQSSGKTCEKKHDFIEPRAWRPTFPSKQAIFNAFLASSPDKTSAKRSSFNSKEKPTPAHHFLQGCCEKPAK